MLSTQSAKTSPQAGPDFDKFFNLQAFKQKFDDHMKKVSKKTIQIDPPKKIDSQEMNDKVEKYQRYLKQVKEKQFNTPKKGVIFDLVRNFFIKSIKQRNLKLEERKQIYAYNVLLFQIHIVKYV